MLLSSHLLESMMLEAVSDIQKECVLLNSKCPLAKTGLITHSLPPHPERENIQVNKQMLQKGIFHSFLGPFTGNQVSSAETRISARTTWSYNGKRMGAPNRWRWLPGVPGLKTDFKLSGQECPN